MGTQMDNIQALISLSLPASLTALSFNNFLQGYRSRQVHSRVFLPLLFTHQHSPLPLPISLLPIFIETAFKAPILEKFSRESSCYYSSARLWDDGVIRPQDTRQVLGLALAVAVKEYMEKTRFGVFRM